MFRKSFIGLSVAAASLLAIAHAQAAGEKVTIVTPYLAQIGRAHV